MLIAVSKPVWHTIAVCTVKNSWCHTGMLTAVSKPVWHIPLLCVLWKNPDDGQRNCPKHVEFYSKNKLEKLGLLVGFIIRICHDARSPEHHIFGSCLCNLHKHALRTVTNLLLNELFIYEVHKRSAMFLSILFLFIFDSASLWHFCIAVRVQSRTIQTHLPSSAVPMTHIQEAVTVE